MWSWFDSPGDSVLVVLHAGVPLTWCGAPVDDAEMMRLAAGKATFRDDWEK